MLKNKTPTPMSVLPLNINYEDAVIGMLFIRHYTYLRNTLDEDVPRLKKNFNANKHIVTRHMWPHLRDYMDLPEKSRSFVSFCASQKTLMKKGRTKARWNEIADMAFMQICENEGREVPDFLPRFDPQYELQQDVRQQALRNTWWHLSGGYHRDYVLA